MSLLNLRHTLQKYESIAIKFRRALTTEMIMEVLSYYSKRIRMYFTWSEIFVLSKELNNLQTRSKVD